MAGVTETAMPQVRSSGGGDQGVAGWKLEWIQRPGAIAPDDHVPRQILHRTTSRIKFNRTIIVSGKLANRNKILDEFRRNKNIIKVKRPMKVGGASGCNW